MSLRGDLGFLLANVCAKMVLGASAIDSAGQMHMDGLDSACLEHRSQMFPERPSFFLSPRWLPIFFGSTLGHRPAKQVANVPTARSVTSERRCIFCQCAAQVLQGFQRTQLIYVVREGRSRHM